MAVPLTPSPLPVLNQLGIDPARIRNMPPGSRRSRCRAIVNWLTQHRLPPQASNLEKVKGFIEAFYHLCEMEEWERAFSLISVPLNTPTREELHYQLKLWGYSQERTKLYQSLVDRVNHRGEEGWNARVLQCLGESYHSQGNYSQAKACYERSLSIFETLKDTLSAGALLTLLGEIYAALGDYDNASNHHRCTRQAFLKNRLNCQPKPYSCSILSQLN
ncbi:MAG: tetratricopeptide repeat protein [Phormidesmis sp. RL_2_1]|nr:tetratricopeptide repeat protein [Phormidesmis sp. RL_2_1]